MNRMSITDKEFKGIFPIEHVTVLVKDTQNGKQWKGIVDATSVFNIDGEDVSVFRVNHVWYRHSTRKPVFQSPWLRGLEVNLIQTYHTNL